MVGRCFYMEVIMIEKHSIKYPAILPKCTANCNLSKKQQRGQLSVSASEQQQAGSNKEVGYVKN